MKDKIYFSIQIILWVIESFFGLIYWNILTMVVSLVRVLLRSGVGCVKNAQQIQVYVIKGYFG